METYEGDLASLPKLCEAVEPTSGLVLIVIEAADAWLNKQFASKVCWPAGIQKYAYGMLMADLIGADPPLRPLAEQKGKAIQSKGGRLDVAENKYKEAADSLVRKAYARAGGFNETCDEIARAFVNQLVNTVELRAAKYEIRFDSSPHVNDPASAELSGTKRERAEAEAGDEQTSRRTIHPSYHSRSTPPKCTALAALHTHPKPSPLAASSYVVSDSLSDGDDSEGRCEGCDDLKALFEPRIERVEARLTASYDACDALELENHSLRDTIHYLQECLGDTAGVWQESCDACKQYVCASDRGIDLLRLSSFEFASVAELQERCRVHRVMQRSAREF